MSAYPPCDASLAQAQKYSRDHGYPVWNYCTTLHCDDNVSYNHQFCYCQGQFGGPPYVLPNGTCINGAGTLIPIADQSCYCCCSCLANDTPVAVSKDAWKAVQQIAVNDLVWVAEDVSLTKWSQRPVQFSSGTGAEGQNRLIKIHFGDQTEGVILNPDSFISQFVSMDQSEQYYRILSTAPNNFIGEDGLVDLMKVREINPDALAVLLGAPLIVAQRIYNILKTDANYLLVTGTQTFLMKDKTLKQAEKLVPGIDELVKEDGSTTPIVSLQLGMYHKGVHHIATSLEPATSPDGHLLVANGIVIGDYATQFGPQSGQLTAATADAPSFGTKAYIEQHAHLAATPFSAHVGPVQATEAALPGAARVGSAAQQTGQLVASFKPYQADHAAHVPHYAFSYVSRGQAKRLMERAPIFPASNNTAEPAVTYLFRMFKSFFPDITFYYDQHNMLPNAYSFKQYGKQFVVLNFGWTAIEDLGFEGIAMTLAHLVAALQHDGHLPQDVNPTGEADYSVYALFLGIFFSAQEAIMNYKLALGQIETIFGYIQDYRRRPHKISLDCRLSAMRASMSGMPLPHCAGGPPDPALEVVSVFAAASGSSRKAVVSVLFNMAVDPATATELGNYFFDPGMVVTSASVDEANPAQVSIAGEVVKGTAYYLSVSGVLSINMQPLIVGKNGAKFSLA